MKVQKMFVMVVLASLITACSPEVGSEQWCANMKKKPKGEWTLEETKDYAKHCIF